MIINTNMLLAAYPVGSLYLTTNEINPGTLFGGTWEKLTGDAYLKIVTSNPGQYDGTSDQHKIPINSMPSHRHGNRVTLNMSQGAGQDYEVVLKSYKLEDDSVESLCEQLVNVRIDCAKL